MTDITQQRLDAVNRDAISSPRLYTRSHPYSINLVNQGRIRVSNNAKIAADLQNGFTFLLWIRPNYPASANLVNQRIFSYNGAATHQRFIEFFINGQSQQTTLFGRISNNSSSQAITSTKSIDKEMCLVGLRYEPGVDFSIILNNSFISGAIPTISPVHNGEHLYIGSLGTVSSFFLGCIGRTLIYQRAITADELEDYFFYDRQPSGQKNLELLMNEGVGTPVDTSGNALTISLQGTTAWTTGMFSTRQSI